MEENPRRSLKCKAQSSFYMFQDDGQTYKPSKKLLDTMEELCPTNLTNESKGIF